MFITRKVWGKISLIYCIIRSIAHFIVTFFRESRIPALATGWSHKYEMLFQDYGFPEGMLAVDSDKQEIQARIDTLISESSRKSLRKNLQEAAEIQKQGASRMWDEVIDLIRQK